MIVLEPNTIISVKKKISRLRKSLKIALIATIVFVVSFLLLIFGSLYVASLDTEYAPGYSEVEFKRLKTGDTLETVLERIGKPLRFAVLIKNTNGVWYTPEHSKDSAILSQWNDEDSFLHLFYSEPGPDNDIYRIREVLIEKGIVVEIRTGIYTD
ncbi:MAG: hypothetical protein EOM12_06655 [Verrucomicrobiae bacterium]|nr:hypothetical protein [Verrucomicrobiae bacterium]